MKKLIASKRIFVVIAALAMALVSNFATSAGTVHADSGCIAFQDFQLNYSFCPAQTLDNSSVYSQMLTSGNTGYFYFWDGNTWQQAGWYEYDPRLGTIGLQWFASYGSSIYVMYPAGNNTYNIYRSEGSQQILVTGLMQ